MIEMSDLFVTILYFSGDEYVTILISSISMELNFISEGTTKIILLHLQKKEFDKIYLSYYKPPKES